MECKISSQKHFIFSKFRFVLCNLYFALLLASPTQAQFASSSYLKSGQWFKIGITQTGVYKIDANFLQNAGFPVSTLNPQHLHLHGYGGGMLPQSNASPRLDDLPENAIFVQGEQDGRFDSGDYILFYGESSDRWSYNTNAQLFEHETNIYADTTYYFICLEDRPAVRLAIQAETVGASTNITQYEEFIHYEKEQTNYLKSGREWYGEPFGNVNEYSFNFTLPDIVNGSPIRLTSAVMGRDSRVTNYEVYLNNQLLGTQIINPVNTDPFGYDSRGRNAVDTYTQTSDGNSAITVRLKYLQNGGFGNGFLNYLLINYKRNLRYPNGFFRFRSLASAQVSKARFVVENGSPEIQIWNVSNPQNPANQQYSLSGSQASFQANSQPLQTYIAFRLQDVQTPRLVGKISNQNLHALEVPDALYICPAVFEGEARRLAQFRQTEGLQIEVVNIEKIYAEFSSGRQDLTALRDFIRSLYLKNPTKFKYVLLFGDASFDYKNRISNNTNFVPIYESKESLQPIFSYSSDDYIGLLDLNEGEWQEDNTAPQSLEVGIGRLPVKNLPEAKWIVDKLIAYSTQKERLGEWRNDIIFVADDGDANTHQQHAEQLAEWLETNAPDIRSEKLYMDIFPQISTPSGERCPDVTFGLQEAIRQGGLIVNYAGHGSETTWAQEKLMEVEQIPAWRNRYRLPFFITATCEFGRYDDPYTVSGAELVLFDVQGGGIGLITTTRPVFSSSNLILNQAFYESAFPANGQMPRLGDILRYTKNHGNTGVINRNFALLGDPTMRLAYPTRKVVLTDFPAEMKALQPITLQGEVRENNALVPDFNGVVTVTVYDKRRTLQTRGTEASKMPYQMRDIVLFKGQATVTNGKFTISFIVPKDIRYNIGTGKVQMYAQHNTELKDASGANINIHVGGSFSNPATDNTPPKVKLYMDTPSFVSGGEVSRESTFWAILEDESGINISQAGLGHEIVAIVDNQTDKPLILNDYFMTDLGNDKKGSLAYLFSHLSAGKHTIHLKVWDIHNNSAEASLEFVVREKTPINITESVVFPNPNSGKPFNFRFKHDQKDKELQATLEIYDTKGHFVARVVGKDFYATETITFEWTPSPTLSAGLYVYKLSLYSPQTFAVGSLLGKIVVD
jgi:hypothetical protein